MTDDSPSNAAELGQKLAQLRADCLVRLYAHTDELQSLAHTLFGGRWSVDGAQKFYMLVHKLAGSSGTFGFSALSRAARQLEQMFTPYANGDEPPWGEPRTILERAVTEVSRLAGQAGNRTDVQTLKKSKAPETARAVFVVEDDVDLARFIGARLESVGYRVQYFENLSDFMRASEVPLAVIMDVILPEGEDAGLQAIARLRRDQGSIPVIVISVRDDARARLAALRAGAARFLTKPIDTNRIVDILDGLVGRSRSAPLRVLLVDDDADVLAYSEAVLGAANMEVHASSRPMEALDLARAVNPDVIVLDWYMPELSGIELASLLREDDAFSHTPILFLSTEADVSKQLVALDFGGDDFLVKPVAPDHLAAAVSSRGKRSRHMQRLVRDMHRVMGENETVRHALDQHAILSITNSDGTILYVNSKFSEISGYSEAELIGKKHNMLKSGVHPDSFYEEMWHTISSGKVWNGVVCNRRKDGSLYWVESTIVPILDEHGLPYQYVSIRTDISAIMEVEARLRAERDFTNAVINAIPGTFYVFDASGTMLRVNEGASRITGYAPDEIIGMKVLEFFAPEDQPVIAESFRRGLEQGHVEVEAPLLTQSGERIPFYFQAARFEVNGQPTLIGTGTDVSVLKHAQKELEKSEQRLRRSQVYANIGTWDWDIQTGGLYWSERIGPLFGYPEGKLETTYENFLAAVHPDDRQRVVDAVNACVERGEKYDVEHRCVWPDGTVRWLLERGDVVRDAQGTPLHMLGVVQDVTTRVTAERLLSDRERFLQTLINGIPGMVGYWTRELRCGFANSHYLEWFGRTSQQMQGITIQELLGEELFRQNEPYIRAALAGETQRFERTLTKADGSTGYTLAHYIPDIADGEVRGFLVLVSDITEIKAAQMQLQELNTSLTAANEEADRANRAKSDFLSSMSHELRTPMNAILGFAQLMEMDLGLSTMNQENLAEILKAGHHLLALINDVLDLAKVEAGHIDLSLEPVSCDELFADCMNLVEPLALKRGIEMQMNSGNCVVRADRTRLKQVLLNLMSNAVKYNRPGGKVWVDSAQDAIGMVRIRVRDTGPGIQPERMADLFQPFNRLGAENGEVEGTGIGLVITRRLVEMMGGDIGVENDRGEGCTFWIELPRDEIVTPLLPEAPLAPADAMPNVETVVLYVEDNPANLRLVSQLLSRRPQVLLLTAHAPSLGLELAATHHPDLVLLDINLPGMDGYAVLRKIRELPDMMDLPVVALTANAMPSDIERGKRAGFTEYLTKPLNVTRFYDVLDALISQRKNGVA